MSEFVCPKLVETCKRSKIKTHHTMGSSHTDLVGSKNVLSVDQYLKLVPVEPKNSQIGPKLEIKPQIVLGKTQKCLCWTQIGKEGKPRLTMKRKVVRLE